MPEPTNEPTVEDLKAQLAAANADRDQHKAERERLAAEHSTAAQRLQALEDANKTDAQKLADAHKAAEDRANAAELRAKETSLRLDVERTARKLGVVDEDAAFRLLDTSKVEYDTSGRPTNVEALLGDLTKAKPYLVAPTPADNATATRGSNPARTRPGTVGGTFTESQIADPTFYRANREAIISAAAQGRIVKG